MNIILVTSTVRATVIVSFCFSLNFYLSVIFYLYIFKFYSVVNGGSIPKRSHTPTSDEDINYERENEQHTEKVCITPTVKWIVEHHWNRLFICSFFLVGGWFISVSNAGKCEKSKIYEHPETRTFISECVWSRWRGWGRSDYTKVRIVWNLSDLPFSLMLFWSEIVEQIIPERSKSLPWQHFILDSDYGWILLHF